MKLKRRSFVIAALVCLWVSAPVPASAQTDRLWSVALTTGWPSPGPAADLEAAMRASGFDEPSGGCILGLCLPVTETPVSHTGLSRSRGFPFTLQLDRRLSDSPWGWSVLYGRTPIGQTEGIHAPFTPLYIDYGADTLAGMATLAGRGFALGVGPALQIARARDADPQFGPSAWEHHGKLGAVVQGRLMLPARSRVFFDANVQYRYVGTVGIGPITPRAVLEPGATFPQSNVSFNHWLVAIGGGVRF